MYQHNWIILLYAQTNTTWQINYASVKQQEKREVGVKSFLMG